MVSPSMKLTTQKKPQKTKLKDGTDEHACMATNNPKWGCFSVLHELLVRPFKRMSK